MQEEGSCSSQEEEAKLEGCFWLGVVWGGVVWGGYIRQFTCVFSAYCRGGFYGFLKIGSPVLCGICWDFFQNL